MVLRTVHSSGTVMAGRAWTPDIEVWGFIAKPQANPESTFSDIISQNLILIDMVEADDSSFPAGNQLHRTI